jgi:uncharacterized protein (TIGR02118 family)
VIKLVVLYNHPEDPEAFDAHYFTTHLRLAQRIPQLRRLDAARIEEVRGGGRPPFHAIAELYYDDEDAMAAAAQTPEYEQALADQPNFNTAGSVAWVCRVMGDDLGAV